MFDLLGSVELAPQPAPVAGTSIPAVKLPSERWAPEPPARVGGGRVCARYLQRTSAPPAYCAIDGLHLFVVGEPFVRRAWAAGRPRAPGPLSALEVLPWYRDDADGFLSATKGNFTLVLADERRARCVVVASRLAIAPFYYAMDGTRLLFSTSLVALVGSLRGRRELDRAAVAELALFNYPLGDRTYFQGIKALRPAEVVRVDQHGPRRARWWDVRQLYEAALYRRDDALELGSELFHASVNDLAADTPRVRVSFTSGFDSRATLAVLNKRSEDLLAYAFGIPGSINVRIPARICARLGVPFAPVYLDDEYAARFDDYALRALVLSDCLSTVERANYPYAFERLAGFSPVVLTGLFGSELMRTFQNVGYIVSANLTQLNLAADPHAAFQRLAARPDASIYFARGVLDDCQAEVESDLSAVLTEPFGDVSPDHRFYLFLLTEGLRKYFGAEVHMERPWGINRFPFLDEEFVEFAFHAPFAGVHARTLRPTIGNRFRSQYFYAYVIRRYRPQLLAYSTDHGYAPADLLRPLPLLAIGSRLVGRRLRPSQRAGREFRTEEWTAALYARHLFAHAPATSLFSEQLRAHFFSGEWQTQRLAFARAASFKLWTEQLEELVGWRP